MSTAKTLIRLGGCPGLSESLLGAQSFCWFSHEAAHIGSYLVYIYCNTEGIFKILAFVMVATTLPSLELIVGGTVRNKTRKKFFSFIIFIHTTAFKFLIVLQL